MGKVDIFIDEGGDMVFALPPRGSRYFIIGSITTDRECTISSDLLSLRRELVERGFDKDRFHATSDRHWVRDRVYDLLADSDFRADVTILDKPKTQDHLRSDKIRFYKQAWFFHFEDLASNVVTSADSLLVVASSLQVNRKKQAIHTAVYDVVQQLSPTLDFRTAFWSAVSDPCLQVADYVVWAIQRKFEKGDPKPYERISSKIASEHWPFRNGSQVFY